MSTCCGCVTVAVEPKPPAAMLCGVWIFPSAVLQEVESLSLVPNLMRRHPLRLAAINVRSRSVGTGSTRRNMQSVVNFSKSRGADEAGTAPREIPPYAWPAAFEGTAYPNGSQQKPAVKPGDTECMISLSLSFHNRIARTVKAVHCIREAIVSFMQSHRRMEVS